MSRDTSQLHKNHALFHATLALNLIQLPPSAARTWYINLALRGITYEVSKIDKLKPKVSTSQRSEMEKARLFMRPMPRGALDHSIPISVFSIDFRENYESYTPETLVDRGRRYATIVHITKEEDKKLRKAGLVKTMPKDWDGIDVYARYKAVDIEIE